MNIEAKVKLVKTVLEKSVAGEVAWEKTTDADKFQATVAGYLVRISEDPDQRDPANPDYVLRIFNREGDLVEALMYSDFREVAADFASHKTLKELFSVARRNALGADRAINEILKALGAKP